MASRASKVVRAVVGCPRREWRLGRCSVGMEIQSILFARDAWTASAAKAWLRAHGYKTALDVKPETLRARQVSPSAYHPDSLRTITLGAAHARKKAPVRGKLGAMLDAVRNGR